MRPTDPRGGSQPRGDEIASYDSYLDAQRAVDYLADKEFSVNAVTIVGTDLKMVERITGRRTYPSVAGRGAASGAYFGFFIGILLFLVGGSLLETLLPGLLIGAGAGMLFSVIAYALSGGKRDFTSTSQVVAGAFSVLCLPEKAAHARQLLAELDGGRRPPMNGPGSGPGTGFGNGPGNPPVSPPPGDQCQQPRPGTPPVSPPPGGQGQFPPPDDHRNHPQ